MKTSLVWRFVVIGLVLVGWTSSLFPLRDREFIPVLERRASKALKRDDTGELQKEFDELLARARKLISEDAELAPYLAVKEAARGDDKHPPVRLSKLIPVPTQPDAPNNQVLNLVRRKAAGKLRLGLDLSGGTEFVIGFDEDEVPEGRTAEGIRDQIIEVLRNRVDRMGVVEPEIKPIGPASISLRMPNVTESNKAEFRKTLKQNAVLQFHLVHERNDVLVRQYKERSASFRPDPGYEYYEMESERDGETVVDGLFLKRRAERIKGEDLNRATPIFNEFGSWSVSLGFNSKGAAAFADVTSNNVGRRLGVVLDGKVYSAPVIKEAIRGGRAEISGSFSTREAQLLSIVLQCGKLPVRIHIDSEFGTDPTLGRDSISSGTWAAVSGLVLVVLFMLAYYRVAGMVAILALVANLLLVLGTLTITGATITLPGIAGIVLTIGMAVDANVLIFERIREELNNGKTLGNAVASGYSRAFVTILDSNLTTLFTAFILLRFGTGPIKGFAVTLGIGIVASMFTALFMTRAVFDLCLFRGWLSKLSMAYFFKEPKIDFMKMRKGAMTASALLLLMALVTAVARRKDALSVDFAGGTAIMYQYETADPPDEGALREALSGAGFEECRVVYKASATRQGEMLEIVIPHLTTDVSLDDASDSAPPQDADTTADSDATAEATAEAAEDVAGDVAGDVAPAQEKVRGFDVDMLTRSLNSAFPAAKFLQAQTHSVGGLVGAQFQRKALVSAFLAAVVIILYISFRFEFAYGVASVAALVHDVVIAGGIYLLWGYMFGGRHVSLPVVAALLTIMGYSLNDTIVVFDRVREDLSLHKDRSYTDIINLSINQTLGRTVLTSLTTLLVVVTLVVFGGGAINDFAFVMMWGVVVGTYSSIFVASTIVASWHKRVRGIK